MITLELIFELKTKGSLLVLEATKKQTKLKLVLWENKMALEHLSFYSGLFCFQKTKKKSAKEKIKL